MAKYSSNVLEMARRGAEAAYDELQAQVAALVRDFPHLMKRTRRQAGRAVAKGERRGRRMSAAARKAVSARMKKYWADRRKAKAASK
jgi:hypothetical protein